MGHVFLKPILFLTGVLEASFLIMFICYSTFAKSSDQIWVGYVILISSVVVGLGVGLLFFTKQRLGSYFLVAWGGFSIGLLFYNSFAYHMDSQVGLYAFAIGMGVIYVILLYFFYDHILIHATAIIGSFMAVFGIGLVAGHYPNPFTIA